MRPLRLAVLAPSWNPLIEPYAGGQEALVATLVAGLRARGHEILLYAAEGTDPDLADELVTFPPVPPLSPIAAVDPQLPEPRFLSDHHAYSFAMTDLLAKTGRGTDGVARTDDDGAAHELYRDAAGHRRIDAVLNHSLHQLPLLLAHLLPVGVPLITTLHTPPFPWLELGAALAAEHRARTHYVAVSEALAHQWPTLPERPSVIGNGVDPGHFSYGEGGDELIWVGRITPEKGIHLAIAAARRAGRRLRIVGPISHAGYFAAQVAPQLDEQIHYEGHLGHEATARLLGRSAAALVTPMWDEPFGLVLVEAAVCGTPVVALDRGGVGEVAGTGDDALGVLVDSSGPEEEIAARLAAAVPVAEAMDRHVVRERALRRHGRDAMVDGYERLLGRLIGNLPTGLSSGLSAGLPSGLPDAPSAAAGGSESSYLPSPALRVQHIPAGHGYARSVTDTSTVIALPDPPVPGAPADQWWPHPALEPSWVAEHADQVDLVHVHFGFEHRTPDELRAWVAALDRAAIPLVLTVHDIANPHLAPDSPEQARYEEGLGVLVSAAAAVTTLTPGAARRIETRWGRSAMVLPHPHVVAPDWLRRSRPLHDGWVVGVHLKSLRTNVDLAAVHELAEAVTAFPDATLRVHVHPEVLDRRPPELTLPEQVRVLAHPPLRDEQLWAELADTDLAVLPYRWGTHSGWSEMCHDLGTAVLAPRIGHIREQHPVSTWDPQTPGDLTRAVRAAHEAHRAGLRPIRPSANDRIDERAVVAAQHARLYRDVLARRDAVGEPGDLR